MNLHTCFLLFWIFAYTNSSSLPTTKENKDGDKINVNGDGAKNNSTNTTIGDNKITARDVISTSVEIFTDFLQEVIKIINTYDDNSFVFFFQILDKELQKYTSKGYRNHELLDNKELRVFIDEKFESIKGKSVSFIKNIINEVADNIKNKKYDINAQNFLSYINSMYKEEDKRKFQKVLTDLNAFGSPNHNKSKNALDKIIRQGIWNVVFKHYTNLNDKEKKKLQKEIAAFLNQSPRFNTKFVRHEPEVSELKSIILDPQNVTTEVFKPKNLKTVQITSTTEEITTKNERRSDLKSKINEDLSADEKTTHESSHDEDDSQQLVLKFHSTVETSHDAEGRGSSDISADTTTDDSDERSSSQFHHGRLRKVNGEAYDTLYIEDFYKTTEKPANVFRSEVDSQAEGLAIEEDGIRLAATRTSPKERHTHRTSPHPQQKKIVLRNEKSSLTTSELLRVHDQDYMLNRDLRRSIAPPMPEEELSIEVFDLERRQRVKDVANSYSFVKNNSIQLGLKDYVKRRRNLKKKISELKEIYDNIQRNKDNVTNTKTDNLKIILDDFEVKDKLQAAKVKDKQIEDDKDRTVANEKQSVTHYERAQTEKSIKKDGHSHEGVKKMNRSNKSLIEDDNSKEASTDDDRQITKRKKTKTAKVKETTKDGTEKKYYINSMTSKLFDLKAVKIPVYIEQFTTENNKGFTETTFKPLRRKIVNEI
ncbi:hypothetical protein PYW08_012105 [Mythimna loreyi]|uniref:Uncharacterized protein n=1 Tax=Mythimna loreyi TaxID=667449 RepID=A0ACC2PZB6_9NEOP|nr:hypothetical protein PYW08_012105 [Mythimna loreyi]